MTAEKRFEIARKASKTKWGQKTATTHFGELERQGKMAIDGKSKAKPAKKDNLTATAIHATYDDTHFVGIGNLKVVICPDDNGWFAQGLEIDYSAGGSTIPQVKKNFEKGLKGTIDLHIKVHGNIEKLLVPAPPEIWKEFYWSGKQFRFTQVSLHDELAKSLSVKTIEFLEPVAGAAA